MLIDRVIVTVPHSFCVAEQPLYRDCDLAARPFAVQLVDRLSMIQCDVTLIESGQNRSVLDDNRYKSDDNKLTIRRDSDLWSRLRRSIDTNLGCLIIDAHSFPESTPNFRGHDCVILDLEPYQPFTLKLCHHLLNLFQELKIYAK